MDNTKFGFRNKSTVETDEQYQKYIANELKKRDKSLKDADAFLYAKDFIEIPTQAQKQPPTPTTFANAGTNTQEPKLKAAQPNTFSSLAKQLNAKKQSVNTQVQPSQNNGEIMPLNKFVSKETPTYEDPMKAAQDALQNKAPLPNDAFYALKRTMTSFNEAPKQESNAPQIINPAKPIMPSGEMPAFKSKPINPILANPKEQKAKDEIMDAMQKQSELQNNKFLNPITGSVIESPFIKEAKLKLGNDAPQEALSAYAKTAADNYDKQEKEKAAIISSTYPDEKFDNIVDKATLLKQYESNPLYQAFTSEDKKQVQDYLNSQEFKVDAIKAANGKDYNLKGIADELAQRKMKELLGAGNGVNRVATNIANSLAERTNTGNGIIDFTANRLKDLGLGALNLTQGSIKAGVKFGGNLEAALHSAIANTPISPLYDPNATFLSSYAKQDAENQKIANAAIPDFNPNIKGMEEGANTFRRMLTVDLPKMAGELGALATGAGKVIESGNIVNRGLNWFRSATKTAALGAKATAAEQAAYLGGTSLRANAANKFMQAFDGVINSAPTTAIQNAYNNMYHMTAMFGGNMFNQNYQNYLDKGYSEKDASKFAMQKTLVTNLAFLPGNFITGGSVSPFTKLLTSKPSITKTIVNSIGNGLKLNTEMAASTYLSDAYDGNPDAKKFINEVTNPIKIVQNTLLTIPHSIQGMGAGLDNQKTQAIARAFENPYEFNQSMKSDVASGKTSKEDAFKVQTFLNAIKPNYDQALRMVSNDGKPITPLQAVSVAVELAKKNEASAKLKQFLLDNAEKTSTIIIRDNETGQEREVKQYLHDDGVWYDTPQQSSIEQASKFINAQNDAITNINNIINNVDTRKSVLTSEDVADIAKKHSLNGELKLGQESAINSNGAYHQEIVPLEQFMKDKEIADKVAEMKQSGTTFDKISVKTSAPPIVDEKGDVIDGKARIAAAIASGGTELRVLKPMNEFDVATQMNDLGDTRLGEDLPNMEGLDEIGRNALTEMRKVYDESLGENPDDYYGAMAKVVKDAMERGYDKAQVMDMAKRVNDGTFSNPYIEHIYEKENKPQEITKTTENDNQNKQGLPSQVGEGEKIIETKLNEGGGEEKIVDGGVLQAPTQQEPIVEVKIAEPKVEVKEDVVETPKDLTLQDKKHNRLAELKKQYNALSEAKRKTAKANEILKKINALSIDLGYEIRVKENTGGEIKILNEKGKDIRAISVKTELPTPTNVEVKKANELIDSGILTWDGDMMNDRIYIRDLTWQEIRNGQRDLTNGKINSVAAKKLTKALSEIYDKGEYSIVRGSGGFIDYVNGNQLSDFIEFKNEELPKEAENYIAENETELAKQYDEWFDSLSEKEQLEQLNLYEDAKNASTEKPSKKPVIEQGESESNVPNIESEKPTAEQPTTEAKAVEKTAKDFEALLKEHKLKNLNEFEESSAIEKDNIEKKAEAIKSKDEAKKFISENFKDLLTTLKEKGIIDELEGIKDC